MPERTYFDSLDDAMAALGLPPESRALARALTPDVPSEIWIPGKAPTSQCAHSANVWSRRT